MPKPRLLRGPGQNVPEWMVSTTELRGMLASRMRPRTTAKLRRFRPLVPAKQQFVFPERIDVKRDLIRPELLLCRTYCPPRYRLRKNQRDLAPVEWARFIHAIEALAESGIPAPDYEAFVDVHGDSMDTMAGMAWDAHGSNFLAWHREYLAKLEARLRVINALVRIPYWNWVEDRAIPAQLSDPADLAAWGIARGTTVQRFAAGDRRPGQQPAGRERIFTTSQTQLQLAPLHNRVHNLVGGTMATSRSPAVLAASQLRRQAVGRLAAGSSRIRLPSTKHGGDAAAVADPDTDGRAGRQHHRPGLRICLTGIDP